MPIIDAYTVLPDSVLSPGEVAQKFQGRSMAGIGRAQFRRGLRALGQTCTTYDPVDGSCLDTIQTSGDSSIDLSYPTGTSVGYPVTGASGQPATGPSGSSVINWTPVANSIATGLIDIAKLETVQPGTVQQGGTTIRQTAGYGVPVPSTSTVLGLNTTTSSSVLILAAIAAVALVFMSKGNRG